MKKAKFNIEGNQNTYKGYAEDRNWNGWACPYFSYEESVRIMNDFNKIEQNEMYYDADTDSFCVKYKYGFDEIYKGVDIVTPDGIRHLYPIGNSCWIWEMQEIFTKADLKTGDVIKRRNGSVEIIICELDVCICDKGWDDLADIAEDLTCVCGDKRHDIVAVRRPKVNSDCKFSAFSWECGTLVYERPIVEEMTLAEVCKALGKEIKIVKE